MKIPDGFSLVTGDFDGCRRDCTRSRTWAGLSAQDIALLVAWMDQFAPAGAELYTDVMCGFSVELPGEDPPAWLDKMAAKISALRIDAIISSPAGWQLLEMKPQAGYVAMGQILTYAYFAPFLRAELRDARLVIVTDCVHEVCRPVYAACGVEVDEVGEVSL